VLIQIEAADRRLLSAISDAMAEAARRGGDWLVCRPGCTQCCFGPFAITALDAIRLQRGLAQLQTTDADRARAVLSRASDYVRATFEDQDDLACPALDPATGCCDLYSSRPITCRTFGPVTHVAGGALGACELCYTGASDEEMAACAVEIDPENIEGDLLDSLKAEGICDETMVAYALVSGRPISQ
jgi:Fe-S-cluster containining protein